MILDVVQSFPAVGPVGYAPWLVAIRHGRHSGIYAILEGRSVLYVGESHSGRLYDTITRHFREWRIDAGNDAKHRRRGGTTYDRRRVRVVYAITEPDTAQTLQYAEIERLRPRDNSIDGRAVDVIPVGTEAELAENPPRDENERRGRAAIRKVLTTRTDVINAMDVPGLGPVSFIWGDLGGGIRHIAEHPTGPRLRAAMRVPRTLARGALGPAYQVKQGEPRRMITYRRDTVIVQLVRSGRSHRWVLTAFRKAKPSGRNPRRR